MELASVEWHADEAELVLGAIDERALCVSCITARTGVALGRVTAILAAVSQTLAIERTIGACSDCGVRQEVVRLF